MRKCISLLLLAVVLSVCAAAGDIPESVLHDDAARLFFAKVTAYTDDGVSLEVVKPLKGDIAVGDNVTGEKPSAVGGFHVLTGNVYLVLMYDKYNPDYLIETTGYDTAMLRFRHKPGAMWRRLETYLRDGSVARAEKERRERLGLMPYEPSDAPCPPMCSPVYVCAIIACAFVLFAVEGSFLRSARDCTKKRT